MGKREGKGESYRGVDGSGRYSCDLIVKMAKQEQKDTRTLARTDLSSV